MTEAPLRLKVAADTRGRRVLLDGLDGTRSVWLARVDHGFAITFTDREGEVTKLALSGEALDALTNLYRTELAKPAAVDDTDTYVVLADIVDGEWRAVWERVEHPGDRKPIEQPDAG